MLVSSLLPYSPAGSSSPQPRQPHTCITFCLQNTYHCQPAILPEPKLHPPQPKAFKASPSPQAHGSFLLFCVFPPKFAWFPFHSHPSSIICWSPYPQKLTVAHVRSTRSQLHPCLCSAPSSAHTSSPPIQAHLSYVCLPCRVQQLWTPLHAAWPPGPSLDLLMHCLLPFDPF